MCRRIDHVFDFGKSAMACLLRDGRSKDRFRLQVRADLHQALSVPPINLRRRRGDLHVGKSSR